MKEHSNLLQNSLEKNTHKKKKIKSPTLILEKEPNVIKFQNKLLTTEEGL
jgi:hypothetical protein